MAYPPGGTSNVHDGVSCDGCNRQNFSGNRFKCLRCHDFDLCQTCFDQKRFSINPVIPAGPSGPPQNHSPEHPMQMIMTHRDFDSAYEGDNTKNYDNCKIASFTCPYCNRCGMNTRNFTSHVSVHAATDYSVICPLCIAHPECDSNRAVEDLKRHIQEMHSQDTTYRNEPQVRTTRRPMLARRTQRNPAGQAGAFPAVANMNLGINVPIGWPEADMDEMLRIATTNRLPIPNLPDGQPGQPFFNTQFQLGGADLTPFRTGFNMFQPANEQAQLLRHQAAAPPTGNRYQRVPMAEYARPRQTSTPRINTNSASAAPSVPMMRSVRVTPVFPDVSASDANAEDRESATTNSVDGIDADEMPLLELDAMSPGDEEEGGVDTSALKESSCDGSVAPSGALVSKGEFEFVEHESDIEEDDDLMAMATPNAFNGCTTSKTSLPDDSLRISREEIWQKIRKTCNAEEISLILDSLKADVEGSLSSEPEEFRSPKTNKVDDLVDQAAWNTIEFPVPAIKDFDIPNHWEDSRFLRHKKLSREVSAAGNTEDLLDRSEIALGLVAEAVGPLAKDCRLYDSPDVSLRRALHGINLSSPPEELEPPSLQKENFSKPNILMETSARLQAEIAARKRIRQEQEASEGSRRSLENSVSGTSSDSTIQNGKPQNSSNSTA